jgi:hypothetical protein
MKHIIFVLFSIVMMTFSQFATAQDLEHREGGLTGTGISGIITHLGSFYVNDQRVTYSDDATANSVLGLISASELRPGDTVATQVQLQRGTWVAQSIRQIHPIVGPISEMTNIQVKVMGTSIDISAIKPSKIAIGDWIAVSGLWRDHEVVASRVVQIPPQEQAHILGSYVPPQEGQELTLGESSIRGLIPQHAKRGDVIRISGQPLFDGLNAQELSLGLFDQPLGLVLAQGYLSRPSSNGHYTILGSGLSAFTDTPSMIQNAEVITSCGRGAYLINDASSFPLNAQADMQRLGCRY